MRWVGEWYAAYPKQQLRAVRLAGQPGDQATVHGECPAALTKPARKGEGQVTDNARCHQNRLRQRVVSVSCLGRRESKRVEGELVS
jgi:hypothetical protein